MIERGKVEILRSVSFIVHEEAALAEPDILDEDYLDGDLRCARIVNLKTPKPNRLTIGEPEVEHAAKAGCSSTPKRPGRGEAEFVKVDLDRPAIDAQQELSDSRLMRRAQDLFEQDWRSLPRMTKRKERAIGEEFGLKAGARPKLRQPEIFVLWCRPSCRHPHDRTCPFNQRFAELFLPKLLCVKVAEKSP